MQYFTNQLAGSIPGLSLFVTTGCAALATVCANLTIERNMFTG